MNTTEEQHVKHIRNTLNTLVGQLTAAAKEGFIIGFEIQTDDKTKETKVLKLTSTRSVL